MGLLSARKGYAVYVGAGRHATDQSVYSSLNDLVTRRSLGMIEAKMLGLDIWMRDVITDLHLISGPDQAQPDQVYQSAWAVAPYMQGEPTLFVGTHPVDGGSVVYVGTAGWPGNDLVRAYARWIARSLESHGYQCRVQRA